MTPASPMFQPDADLAAEAVLLLIGLTLLCLVLLCTLVLLTVRRRSLRGRARRRRRPLAADAWAEAGRRASGPDPDDTADLDPDELGPDDLQPGTGYG